MNDKLSSAQYETITTKLSENGYNKDTVYDYLKDHDFKVKFEGEIHSVHASRIIAIMRSREKAKYVDLDK